jgi:hypothetical protein
VPTLLGHIPLVCIKWQTPVVAKDLGILAGQRGGRCRTANPFVVGPSPTPGAIEILVQGILGLVGESTVGTYLASYS